MLRLRHWKPADSDVIASWIKDETALREWSADRFGAFPVTGGDITEKYLGCNGDCAEEDNFYPVTAFDEQGVAGHLIMRYTDAGRRTLRLGFVIVDDSRRGEGLGGQLVSLALRYAFDLFGAEAVTLGVFENNLPAYRCYTGCGFEETVMDEEIYYSIGGERWKCIELAISKEEYYGRRIY